MIAYFARVLIGCRNGSVAGPLLALAEGTVPSQPVALPAAAPAPFVPATLPGAVPLDNKIPINSVPIPDANPQMVRCAENGFCLFQGLNDTHA